MFVSVVGEISPAGYTTCFVDQLALWQLTALSLQFCGRFYGVNKMLFHLNEIFFYCDQRGNRKELLLRSLAILILKTNRALKYMMPFEITKGSKPADRQQNTKGYKRAHLCYCAKFSNKRFLLFSTKKEIINHNFCFTPCELRNFKSKGDAKFMSYHWL